MIQQNEMPPGIERDTDCIKDLSWLKAQWTFDDWSYAKTAAMFTKAPESASLWPDDTRISSQRCHKVLQAIQQQEWYNNPKARRIKMLLGPMISWVEAEN